MEHRQVRHQPLMITHWIGVAHPKADYRPDCNRFMSSVPTQPPMFSWYRYRTPLRYPWRLPATYDQIFQSRRSCKSLAPTSTLPKESSGTYRIIDLSTASRPPSAIVNKVGRCDVLLYGLDEYLLVRLLCEWQGSR